MEQRNSVLEILSAIGYVLVCLLLLAMDILAGGVLVQTFRMETSSVERLRLHEWLAFGFVAFFISFLIPRVRNNVKWLMKFTHEFTHLLFAILFCREIHRFKVDEKDSHVSYGEGWFGYHAITLSPYCIPVFTYALLPWRFTTNAADTIFLSFIDVLIGFTFAFHVCCWIRQTHLQQTDIIGPGVVKSILAILLFQIIGICLVALTPSSGILLAFQRVFVDFPSKFLSSVFLFDI